MASALPLLKRALAWVAGVAALLLLFASSATERFDNALYDAHMRHWSYPTSDKVMIVAIDPQSLATLGNWPWPRAIHAKLIERLSQAGVRGIGVDIAMAEADISHPGNDRAFAESIGKQAHVVMPVFAEAAELGGVLEEILPTPDIARNAAALGHVDAAKDSDGVTRGVYLKAGLGRPQWPALALALYDMGKPEPLQTLPGLRRPDDQPDSPYQWMRDNYALIRFAGNSGSFDRVSYVDVLQGRVPPELLTGRWILIGATAAGLGDQLATSASGINDPLPGVEYQANVLESLYDNSLITPLSLPAQLLLGALLLALLLVLFGMPGFRRSWPVALVALVATPMLSLWLLRRFSVWWPPGCCLLVTASGLVAHVALSRLEQRHERRMTSRLAINDAWWTRGNV
ncbi:CHASE2 domain-containing protein [Dyella halodurans]|uniref:CHASE2 domain-containing protein n=1 Tax=Dyella halodurans TaxID=1920171 RepID=A0ABV9BX47_9GAMM|nr:CHASE2 domain-containing protein [Dyella halodurans]